MTKQINFANRSLQRLKIEPLESAEKGIDMSTPRWEWQDYYLEALLDTNPMNRVERVEAAEKAISLRTRELRASPGGEAERQAIADAISGLAILKRESKSTPKPRPAARSSK